LLGGRSYAATGREAGNRVKKITSKVTETTKAKSAAE